MPAPYPPVPYQLETALLVTLRDAIRWESALSPLDAQGTYSGTLFPPATESVPFRALEYQRRDRELAWMDLRNAAAVVEVSLEIADVWNAAALRPALQGPQVGHITASPQDFSSVGLTSKVVHVKHASIPVNALATDRDLAGRDLLVYETLSAAVQNLFSAPPISSSGKVVTGVSAWSYASGTARQKDINTALPLNRDLFRDPDTNLADRDNQMAGYVAQLCQVLKNPFAYANRLYVGVYGLDAREVETYTLAQEPFVAGQTYLEGDEIYYQGDVYRVKSGIGSTSEVPWTSPWAWETVASPLKRVWTCEPALPGRNRVVYDVQKMTLQWFREVNTTQHVPQLVALSIPGLFSGQTVAVQAQIPERKDGLFWRNKARHVVPAMGTLSDLYSVDHPASFVTSGFLIQRDGASLTVPGTGQVSFIESSSTLPKTLTPGYYHLAALVEPNALIELPGGQNTQGLYGTLGGATFAGPNKINWQLALPPTQWTVEFDYTNLSGSTEGFRVFADLGGVLVFDDTAPFYFNDDDGNPLPNGQIVTSQPFPIQPTGASQVFSLAWTGGAGQLHLRTVRFRSEAYAEGRYRVSGTLVGFSAIVDVVGENRVPGVMAWDFYAGTTAPAVFTMNWERDAQLPLRVLRVDLASVGTTNETPNSQGLTPYRHDCLVRAVRSAQQSFNESFYAGTSSPEFASSGSIWDADATERWMSTIEQAEPRLRTRQSVVSGAIMPQRQYVVSTGSLIYEGYGYGPGQRFVGNTDTTYVWAASGTVAQEGAWAKAKATHLGRPGLAPAGVYFDYTHGTVTTAYPPERSVPELATLQPWMIKSGFYSADDAFLVEPFPLNGLVTSAPPAVTVTVATSPTGSGTTTGAGVYNIGETVNLLATASGAPVPGVKPVDILFMVDESGSMDTEHTWLETLPSALETALLAAGIGVDPLKPNRYGLLGFSSTAHLATQKGHKHTVGSGDWGTAAQAQTAAGGLVTGGGYEDGYEAIFASLNGYSFRTGATIAVILITDEARAVLDATITKPIVENLINAKAALFAIVGNFIITDTVAAACIGRKGAVTYKQSGSSYVLSTFQSIVAGTTLPTSYNATAVADYADLAEDVGGTTWDLNSLRAGGAAATAFSAAFVDITKNTILFDAFYSFSYWVINGSPVYGNPYAFVVTGDTTVTAYFAL